MSTAVSRIANLLSYFCKCCAVIGEVIIRCNPMVCVLAFGESHKSFSMRYVAGYIISPDKFKSMIVVRNIW